MIHVIATIEVAEGQREAFLAELQRNVPHVLEEAGCLEYGPVVDLETDLPMQSPPRPDHVVILEQWESLDALKAHMRAPHMIEYRQRVKDLVRGVTLQILRPA